MKIIGSLKANKCLEYQVFLKESRQSFNGKYNCLLSVGTKEVSIVAEFSAPIAVIFLCVIPQQIVTDISSRIENISFFIACLINSSQSLKLLLTFRYTQGGSIPIN